MSKKSFMKKLEISVIIGGLIAGAICAFTKIKKKGV